MKGYDNGQFLQPISVCFLQMPMGEGVVFTKAQDKEKDDQIKSIHVPIIVVGDSNNKLQVRQYKIMFYSVYYYNEIKTNKS